MKLVIFLLIIINVFLGLFVVTQKHQMLILTQNLNKEVERETALNYEYNQWNTEKELTEAGLKIEFIAKNKLGFVHANDPVATISVNQKK